MNVQSNVIQLTSNSKTLPTNNYPQASKLPTSINSQKIVDISNPLSYQTYLPSSSSVDTKQDIEKLLKK
jgi:hypothetical protein